MQQPSWANLEKTARNKHLQNLVNWHTAIPNPVGQFSQEIPCFYYREPCSHCRDPAITDILPAKPCRAEINLNCESFLCFQKQEFWDEMMIFLNLFPVLLCIWLQFIKQKSYFWQVLAIWNHCATAQRSH